MFSAGEAGPEKALGKCISGLFKNPGKIECQRSNRAIYNAPQKLRKRMTESSQTVGNP